MEVVTFKVPPDLARWLDEQARALGCPSRKSSAGPSSTSGASASHHGWAVEQLAVLAAPLYTCEAVIAEAVYLLARAGVDAVAPLDLVARGAVAIEFALATEHSAVSVLIARYAPRMDLAGACLVRMTELHPDSRVLTLDADFRVYRRHGRQVIPAIVPPEASRRRRRSRRRP